MKDHPRQKLPPLVEHPVLGDRSGAAVLLSVLLLAAITLLVGFGRCHMYRNQVRLRLDRQREVQQELATRSTLQWLMKPGRKDELSLPYEDEKFSFSTVRGGIRVTLHPADPVFPRRQETGDFDIRTAGRNDMDRYDYVKSRNNERFVLTQRQSDDETAWALTLANKNSETGQTHGFWVDIADSRVAALWTDSDFGLRYLAYVNHFCASTPGVSDSDLLRFSLTPLGTDPETASYAIWMEQDVPSNLGAVGGSAETARLRLFARWPGNGPKSVRESLLAEETVRRDKSKGFQLAATKATIVQQYIANNEPFQSIRATKTFGVVDLDETMGSGFVEQFAAACGDGIRLTVDLEVRRPRDAGETLDDYDTAVSKIAVTPAYEYSTILAWGEPDGSFTRVAEEMSTVVRCNPVIHGGIGNDPNALTTVTYDTHGTYANRKRHLGEVPKE